MWTACAYDTTKDHFCRQGPAHKEIRSLYIKQQPETNLSWTTSNNTDGYSTKRLYSCMEHVHC